MTVPEAVATVLSGGGLVAVLGFLRWYMRWRRKTKDDNIPNVLRSVVSIYTELSNVLTSTDACRVLLLRAENGGAIPTAGKAVYSTVVYEVYEDGAQSLREEWNHQKLDELYVSMLLEVATKGQDVLRTKKLKSNVLKDLFVAHGIEFAHVVKVRQTEGSFYYLSIEFKQEVELTPLHRNMVRAVANRISRLLEAGGS